MENRLEKISFVKLNNTDTALRCSMLLLASDKNYQLLPFRQIITYYRSIITGQYILMLNGQNAVGIILWNGITNNVRDICLAENRAPYIHELCDKSDTIYCTAFMATEKQYLKQFWKYFTNEMTNKDILIKRHFLEKTDRHTTKLIRKGKVLTVLNKTSD